MLYLPIPETKDSNTMSTAAAECNKCETKRTLPRSVIDTAICKKNKHETKSANHLLATYDPGGD